jgi:CheY-like chemotaxis protein
MSRNPTILLVEDDAAIRDAMTLVLGVEGYEVIGAADGAEGLGYLRSHSPPCVILLDLRTPGMDGWKFREEQLKDPAICKIPVIVVSGADNVKAEAASCRAAGYIQKPIDAATLISTVGLFACNGPPEILLVEDEPAVSSMVCAALGHHGFTVRRARSKNEALSLYRKHQEDVALVLLDAKRPAVAAEETLAELRQLNPDVRYCLINRTETSGTSPGNETPGGADAAASTILPDLADAAQFLRGLAGRA